MPLIKYQNLKFRPDSLDRIRQVNVIIRQYAAQGYDLTLRQLYYQLVARAIVENKQTEAEERQEVARVQLQRMSDRFADINTWLDEQE